MKHYEVAALYKEKFESFKEAEQHFEQLEYDNKFSQITLRLVEKKELNNE